MPCITYDTVYKQHSNKQFQLPTNTYCYWPLQIATVFTDSNERENEAIQRTQLRLSKQRKQPSSPKIRTVNVNMFAYVSKN